MKDRPRRGRQFWLDAIENQLDSGLAIEKWCKQHQLAVSTFCKWKQKLKTNNAAKPVAISNAVNEPSSTPPVSSALVELTPVASPTDLQPKPARLIEASLADGTLLRFHGAVDADTIRALIAGDHSGGQV